jgi:TatD DNase family protein
MAIIDTHCHLNADTFSHRWQQILNDAQTVGVDHAMVVGWDETSSRRATALATLDPRLHAVIGLHPVDVQPTSSLDWITTLYQQHPSRILAIGEIGLDFYWKKDPKEHELQAQSFISQIHLANALQLPVVIHCRDAYEAILPILERHPVQQGGIMHCYAGPSQLVPRFISLGFYLSFGGPITFKNAHDARMSLLATPLNRILVETDSPYLAPHPFRGKENSPIHLPIIVDKIQETLNISKELLTKTLYQNTLQVFHVKTL